MFSIQVGIAGRLSTVETFLHLLQNSHFFLHLFVATLCLFADAVDALLNGIQISQVKFRLYHFNITQWINTAIDMHDILIFKTANNMGNGVNLTNVPKKLVTQAFSATRPFHQSGDIDKLHGCWQHLLWIDNVRQLIKPLIGNCYDPNIRLNGAERIIGRFGASGGDRVKDSRLADIWQANDAAFESHNSSISANNDSRGTGPGYRYTYLQRLC